MERLAIGYVARAHGVRGELRVHLHAPGSTVLASADRAWFGGVERRLESVREVQGALLVKLEGVDDRDAAEALRGQAVEVRREDVPLAAGEVLVADLVGCAVVDEAGAPLGEIVDVLHGPQDLLVLHDERVERLLPLVPEFVVSIDVAARRVVVAPPEDLPAEPLSRGRKGKP